MDLKAELRARERGARVTGCGSVALVWCAARNACVGCTASCSCLRDVRGKDRTGQHRGEVSEERAEARAATLLSRAGPAQRAAFEAQPPGLAGDMILPGSTPL
eukprot:2593957-Rhodomonas_salina.5